MCSIPLQGANCELQIAGGSLMFSSAGWLTNTAAAACVQRPVEMAMTQVMSGGLVDNLLFKWLPPGVWPRQWCSYLAALSIAVT